MSAAGMSLYRVEIRATTCAYCAVYAVTAPNIAGAIAMALADASVHSLAHEVIAIREGFKRGATPECVCHSVTV